MKVCMMVSDQTKGPVMMCSGCRTKSSDRLAVPALLTINTHTCAAASVHTLDVKPLFSGHKTW